MALVSLETAKGHLKVDVDDWDEDIDRKIEQASAVIVDYLKSRADDGWSDGTVAVPGPVEAATLLMLTHIHENRGNDMKADEALWAAVRRLLERFRDPAYA